MNIQKTKHHHTFKTFQRVTLILIIMTIPSCGLFEPGETQPDYFPLEVGNKWYYGSHKDQNLESAIVFEVTGKTLINNTEYFVFTSPWDTSYYRKYYDRILELITSDGVATYNIESTFVDFGLSDNETSKYFGWVAYGFGIARYYDVTLTSSVGVQKTYYYDGDAASDDAHSITFEEDIGIVEMDYGSAIWYLLHYELK